MCRPFGTQEFSIRSLPGTAVPGYRLFRSFGTESSMPRHNSNLLPTKPHARRAVTSCSPVRTGMRSSPPLNPEGMKQSVARHGSAGYPSSKRPSPVRDDTDLLPKPGNLHRKLHGNRDELSCLLHPDSYTTPEDEGELCPLFGERPWWVLNVLAL